jgi:hypothetical protein
MRRERGVKRFVSDILVAHLMCFFLCEQVFRFQFGSRCAVSQLALSSDLLF